MRLALLLLFVLPGAVYADKPESPLVFMYGAQDIEIIPQLPGLGMNAVYLSPEVADSLEFRKLDERIETAAQNGMKTIIGIPTVPREFGLLPSPESQRYRDWVSELIERMIERFGGNPNVVAWATGDFLEDSIDYNAANFRAYMERKYVELDALNASWATRYRDWGAVNHVDARALDKNMPMGLGRASVDIAEYRRQMFRDTMAIWAEKIKQLDPSRTLMTGRIYLYRGLSAVPHQYDVVCPFMAPDLVGDDPLSHNVHAVDMARHRGRFDVIPCFSVPLTQGEYRRLDMHRWIGLAALHGAAGFALADWKRIEEGPAPGPILAELGTAVRDALKRVNFDCEPTPTIAFLWEPYVGGFDKDGKGVYGFLEGVSEGEPSNPFEDFRLGCRYGIVDFITLDELPLVDLKHYGAVLAPQALSLPDNVALQLAEYAQSGGAFMTDIGAGSYQTRSWLELPRTIADTVGVERMSGMKDVLGHLRVAWTPDWLPSLTRSGKTIGSHRTSSVLKPGEIETTGGSVGGKQSRRTSGTPEERRGYHVAGPAAFAKTKGAAAAIAILETAYQDEELVIAGLVGGRVGAGLACFATHRLWANWVSSDPIYAGLHDGLCSRRAAIEILDSPFWTTAVSATSTREGVAFFNARAESASADVICYDAGHSLFSAAVCKYSALARRPDGTRSGAVRLSFEVPSAFLHESTRLPVLVQPYADTCLARPLVNDASRLVIEVGGHDAPINRTRDGKLTIGEGAATEVRLTVRDGAYSVKPGSAHRVSIDHAAGRDVRGTLTATGSGELRFSEVIRHAVVTIRPE